MRKAIVALAAVLALSASAIERPPLAVGFTYDHASEYHQNGFGLKLQACVGSHFRLEPEMIYCTENLDVTTLHLNLNVQYVMPIARRLDIYPYVGLSYSHWGYEGPNVNRWGANLGAGIEFDLGRSWSVLAELRLQPVKSETQLLTIAGLKYSF